MKAPSKMPRLKGYRVLREVVVYAVWANHRFVLNTAGVEDQLAKRGVIVRTAMRFLKGLVSRFGAPRVIVTDKLRRYVKPIRELALNPIKRVHIDLKVKIFFRSDRNE